MAYYIMSNELTHHGILGQKWGVRRYQNPDGSLTEAGKKRYGNEREFANRVYSKSKDVESVITALKSDVYSEVKDSKKLAALDKNFKDAEADMNDEYIKYHDQITSNKPFLNQIKNGLMTLPKTLSEQDYDFEVFEYIHDLTLPRSESLNKKIDAFYKAGDEYFKEIDSICSNFTKKYSDVKYSDIKHGKIDSIMVRNMINDLPEGRGLGSHAWSYKYSVSYLDSEIRSEISAFSHMNRL